MNKPNSRAFNRYNSKRKALRKKRLAESLYPCSKAKPYYSNLHQYSKNKIHCSCYLCSAKTARNGYKISDQRKIDKLEYCE